MQLGKITPAHIIFLTVLICGAMLYFGITNYILPKFSIISENQKKIEKMSRDLAEIEQIKKSLLTVRNEIKTLLSESRYLEKALLEKQFIPTILQQIELLGIHTQINITSISPKPTEKISRTKEPHSRPTPTIQSTSQTTKKVFSPDKEYTKINVEINLEGTYRKIMDFLNELVTFPKPVIVEKISAKSSSKLSPQPGTGEQEKKEEENEIVLTVKMPLSFYVAKKPM